jgi:hypothetical protein
MATNKSPSPAAAAEAAAKPVRRSRLSQEDVPGYSLDQALRVPRAIGDSYAFKPTRPMNVAGAMKMSPSAGPFRGITGAAIAYGLTTGGYNSAEIGITPLGMRIVRPTREGDDLAAKREALLRPKVVGEFLRQYDAAPLPTDQIAKNVLQEKGVPAERLDDVLALILEGAKAVRFLRDISGKQYVDLAGAAPAGGDNVETQTEPAAVTPAPAAAPAVASPVVSVAPGVHINIEIHIAADATSQVVEDIFRNMRRYVLSGDGPAEEE